MSTCEPLEGNADFYGLGIRIGIYLQWGSAWLSLLLDPESAQSVLDANSASLFAVAIATIIAARRNAPAIEMYIMLQILLGFPVTTLSLFGFRLWLMNPRHLGKLRSELSRLWREDSDRRERRSDEVRQRRENRRQGLQQRSAQRRASIPNFRWHWILDKLDLVFPLPQPEPQPDRWLNFAIFMLWNFLTLWYPQPFFQLFYIIWHLPVLLPLRFISSLKFPGLSWAGVLWRAMIVALLMGYNLAYWFGESGHSVQEPPSSGCGPPNVFMFTMQPLEGVIVTIARVAAVTIAVIVGPPALSLLMLTLRVIMYGLLFLYRDVYFLVTSHNPRLFKDALDRINRVLGFGTLRVTEILESYSLVLPLVTMTGLNAGANLEKSMLDLLEFMSAHGVDNSIRFSDVIKVGVSLGMGKPVKRQTRAGDSEPRVSRAQTMLSGWGATDSK